MLDIEFIKQNKDLIKQTIVNKKTGGIKPDDIDLLLELHAQIKALKTQIDELRRQRNELAESMKQQANQGKKPDIQTIQKGKELKAKIQELEDKLRKLQSNFKRIYDYVPNIYSKDTPIGQSENDNVVVSTWGQKPAFDFTPKTHDELLKNLGVLDAQAGTDVAGFRGYFLLGDLALMHWAVLTFAFEHIAKKGFIPVIPPTLAKYKVLYGAGQFPWGEEDTFKLANPHTDEDYYLIGTAEQPLMALLANKTIPEDKLPIKLVGFSPAYRREAGAHQKDLKGIIRLHEFWKVEQIVIAPPDEQLAYELHEEITQNAEEILQALGLHYRKLAMCSADMGNPHFKKYDLEAWRPGANKYQETHSSSIMSDFQCRRNNIRVKLNNGKTAYAWSLNNTAIASPRILAVLTENYQNKDGTITVPEVLRPYMLGKEKIEKVELV